MKWIQGRVAGTEQVKGLNKRREMARACYMRVVLLGMCLLGCL